MCYILVDDENKHTFAGWYGRIAAWGDADVGRLYITYDEALVDKAHLFEIGVRVSIKSIGACKYETE